jgi:hypothetical protein
LSCITKDNNHVNKISCTMSSQTPALLFNLFLAVSLTACADEGDDVAVNCTEEFGSSILHVPGDPLTESYTIRISTADTIKYVSNSDLSPGYYIVLNDHYQPNLENQQDSFRFIGKRGNDVIVREDYVFKADYCHITKVSGKDIIKQ